jgi:alpha-N-acetylglucosaminidase
MPRVRVLAARHRSAPNYVTLAYSGAWWDRARWEREIDWMALNGINTPLAITGQEAVWQATLRRFRMNDQEIRRFFAGPAYLAWQWMTNMEQFGGPLPQAWIDSHLELGRFIVDRERELGMTPVLQGFSVNVPLSFLEKFPEAKIRLKQVWCEVTPGTAQLDPGEPLFAELGRVFLEEQKRLFGAGHLYAVDPFHESEPPVKTPAYLHEIGARSFAVVNDFDPQGVIVMQGWTLREEVMKAIPADRMLVIDLTGEKWRDTQAFWGRPWVAGVVHNFGGRNALGGNLPHLAANAPALLADSAKGGNLVGVGFFCEGSEHNPLVYDLATGLGWQRTAPDLPAWVRDWVHARYGRDLPAAQSAWARLLASVYSQGSPDPQMESPLLSRPALAMTMASPWGSFERDYDVSQVWTAWNELLSASGSSAASIRTGTTSSSRSAGLADLLAAAAAQVAAVWISRPGAVCGGKGPLLDRFRSTHCWRRAGLPARPLVSRRGAGAPPRPRPTCASATRDC